MSTSTVQARFRLDGQYFDPTSAVLSDETGSFGVRRLDTLGVVVAAGTSLERVSAGIYQYQFEDAASGVQYEYVVSAEFNGTVYRQRGLLRSATSTDSLSSLEGFVVPRIGGGCPVELIRQELRRAFQSFCRDTELWEERISGVTVADQAYYALSLPSGTTIHKVLWVKVGGQYSRWLELSGSSEGVTLAQAPSTSGTALEACVVLVPLVSRTVLPEWIKDRYGVGIAKGAEAALKAMRGAERKPNGWFDAVGAREAASEFRSAIAAARIEAMGKRGPTIMLPIPAF